MPEIVKREALEASHAAGNQLFSSYLCGWLCISPLSIEGFLSFYGRGSTSICSAGKRDGRGSLSNAVCFIPRGGLRDAIGFLFLINLKPDLKGCWRNGFKRPVLKHGPRSLTHTQVFGCLKPLREMKVNCEMAGKKKKKACCASQTSPLIKRRI